MVTPTPFSRMSPKTSQETAARRYIEHPPLPTTPHTRSAALNPSPYQVPTSRVSYADTRHPAAGPQHAIHSQLHIDLPIAPLYPCLADYRMPRVHQRPPRQRIAVACRYCRRRKVNYLNLMKTDTIDPMLRISNFT